MFTLFFVFGICNYGGHMFGSKVEIQSHEDVLSFITNMIEIRFKTTTQYELDKLITKYREKLFIHDNGIGDLKELCRVETKSVLENISQRYIEDQIFYYLSDSGLVEFVYSVLFSHCQKYAIEKLSKLKTATTTG